VPEKRLHVDRFRVRPGTNVRLGRWPTRTKPSYTSHHQYKKLLANHVDRLSLLQSRHYAANRYAFLIVIQAMDAAGKDSVIKHVMSGVNPQGVAIFAFKRPSATELEHDFLWRTTLCLPERGRIGIFNRSYYEEVLVVRVHPEILAGQNLPPEIAKDENIWDKRFQSIRNFERHLNRNGTKVVKFYLHLSKEEQRKRFLERIDDPDKNWKFSAGDVAERKSWKAYMSAYEQCLTATSTRSAPWYIVPADDERNTRLIVSQVIVDHLEALHPNYPELAPEKKRELRELRRKLSKRGT
jgi:PPK2 family polyphosphate:nucleotide phosphotransferase